MFVTSTRSGELRLRSVLGRALSRPADIGSHPTTDRIMDATLDELAETGLAELVVEEVARRAGVTRMTVYRRFGDRQRLIEATLARESARLLAAVAAADDPKAGPVDRIVRIVTTSLTVARRHPLVAHWLATNPGELLDAVLANDAAVLRAGAAYVAATIRAASAAGRPSRSDRSLDADRTGELLVRLFAALVLMPPPSIDLDDPRQIERLARELIVPILVSRREDSGRSRGARALAGSAPRGAARRDTRAEPSSKRRRRRRSAIPAEEEREPRPRRHAAKLERRHAQPQRAQGRPGGVPAERR